MTYHARFEKVGELVHDALIAGNAHLLVGRRVTIAQGEALPRGALIGIKYPTTEYALAAPSAGIQPELVLAEAVDGVAPRVVLAYSRGDFNVHAVTIRAGENMESATETLRAKGIVLLPALT